MITATLSRPLELIRSDRGSLHCLQASFMMAVRGLVGHELSWEEAERLTGYVPGRSTWPYAMFLSLSDLGLAVHSIETFDPAAMASDPAREVRRIFGEGEVAESVIAEMDLEYEAGLASRCLKDPRITFEVRAPEVEDVIRGLKQHMLPLVSLDYGRLHSTGKYEGHMVVVGGASKSRVQLFDPGPPGDAGVLVSLEDFKCAMYSPTPESGAVILVGSESRSR